MRPTRRPQPVSDRYLRFGLASWEGRPPRSVAFHRHNEIELHMVERGTLTYLFSRRHLTLPAGTLHVFWGALPHKLVAVSPGAHTHWLTVPLPWFLQWGLPDSFQDALMAGEIVAEPDAGRFQRDLECFKQWHADLPRSRPEELRTVLLEVEARLRRLARARLAGKGRARGRSLGLSAGAERVEQLAQFIGEHYREPLAVAEIAAAAGLNPEYATTLFRKSTGMTLVDYVTEHRVSHAQRLLITTQRKVLDVALDSGFGSLSRFYDAFTKACGQTPRAFRASTRLRAAAGR